jgi:transposase-like protein
MRIVERMTQPQAIRVAAGDLGVGQATLARIVRQLRTWLLALDPTGSEEAKVQLGGLVLSPRERKPRPEDSIDPVFTRAIDGAVQTLRSRRDTPVPTHCPHCASARVRLHLRANAHTPVPTYRCMTCRRNFTRLTGTPLARSRWPEKQRKFVRYLSLPIQLTDAADLLGVDYGTVRDWRARYTELVAQIDPSGALAERIRISPALTGKPCENCGRVDAQAWDGTRRWHCAGCGRFLGTSLAAG